MSDLVAYANGTASQETAARIEADLARDPEVRAELNELASPDRLASNYEALEAELDAPRPPIIERFLLRVRLPEPIARLMRQRLRCGARGTSPSAPWCSCRSSRRTMQSRRDAQRTPLCCS